MFLVVTGLVGALVVSSYKWGYFAFGCFALVYIVYQLVWESRLHAKLFGRDVERAFLMCGSLTSFLWILYPVAWGLCEGGNVIAPDSEAIFYGILDFLAKPVFGALLIWGHRNIDPARLGLSIKDYGDADAVVHEKRGPAVHPVSCPSCIYCTQCRADNPSSGRTHQHCPCYCQCRCLIDSVKYPKLVLYPNE